MKRPKELISRAFKEDFPQFVDRAKALGVCINLSQVKRRGNGRVYWLDGYRQLTGYTTKRDGRPFLHEDAVRNIDKALTAIEEDRRTVEAMTIPERFARVMEQMRQIEPRPRMIGGARMPNGDRGHCFFNAEYAGGVRLQGIGDVAHAKAPWRRDETNAEHMARFCDLLQADFERRQHELEAAE